MNLKRIIDSDTDSLLDIWDGKSMEEIAGELWDNFGSDWCKEEFDFIARELSAMGDDEDYEFEGYESFESIVAMESQSDIFQHLSESEKGSMLDYYGVDEDEDEDEDETLFENDKFDVSLLFNGDPVWTLTVLAKTKDGYNVLSEIQKDDLEMEFHLSDFFENLKGKLDKETASFLIQYINDWYIAQGENILEQIEQAKEEWANEEDIDDDNFEEFFKNWFYDINPDYFSIEFYVK